MNEFKKGQHIWFLFRDDGAIEKPIYHLSHSKSLCLAGYTYVEYAPKKRGEWLETEDGWKCSRCGTYVTKKERKYREWWYCTVCGSQNLEAWFPGQD